MYMSVRNIDVVSIPYEWSCIYVSGISVLSLFLVSGHVYLYQEYRCSLCSLLCGHVYMCQEYRCCLCSLWVVMYICVSGISMLSLFLVSGHVYMCQEYRCCLCSLWVVMYMCVRNIDVVCSLWVVMYMSVRKIDVVSVPCEWSCICLSRISMLSLFLVIGHVYMCQEYRCCLCSLLWYVSWYVSVRNICHEYRCVPCEWSCICLSGISMLSLFVVNGHCVSVVFVPVYVYVSGISMVSLFLVSGPVYVCQEYRCCLCSLWVIMYICVRNIDVVSVPCCVVMYMCVRNIDVVSVPCCVVMYICVRNIDVVSVPCESSCIWGISMLSLFLVVWSCICVSGISM